eukprot:9783629-Alexandrium_andersonii.AAC.1
MSLLPAAVRAVRPSTRCTPLRLPRGRSGRIPCPSPASRRVRGRARRRFCPLPTGPLGSLAFHGEGAHPGRGSRGSEGTAALE